MAALSLSYTAVTGDTITAGRWNTMGTEITNSVNSVTNAQIAADAAIAYSKLSLSSSIVNADISGSAAIAQSKLAGTWPASGIIVGTTDTQTLTNKTLTTPTLSKPTVNGSVQAYTTDSDGGTITFDMSASNVHTVTLAGNRTLAVSNTSTGQAFVIRLVQDGTGSRTVTWFSTIKWPAATVPTLTTTGSRVDTFGFITTGTNTYDGYIIGQNLA